MEFSGPERSDLQDVLAINRAYLSFLRNAAGEPYRQSLPQNLSPALRALNAKQVERLSRVPFLLPSMGESGAEYSPQKSQGRAIRDLFVPTRDAADPMVRIATATAGFLWQLARKNPYAARVVSGGTLTWCEKLAEQPLLRVLEGAADDQILLLPRLADNAIFWHRLLGAGVSAEFEIRRAAHLGALQAVLTQATAVPARRLQTAACYSAVPSVELRRSAGTSKDR